MKRLLLVSYAFPPAPSPGALRPGYIARYLPQFGWQATVLTQSAQQPPFDVSIVAAGEAAGSQLQERMRSRMGSDPHTPVRTLLRNVKDALLFPDPTAPWMGGALRAGFRALSEQRFDAIMSTALPSSVHVIGWMLARRSGLPWVADYRDPWSANQYMPWGPVKRRLERSVERMLLRRAQAITTISDPIADTMTSLRPELGVIVVPNAYDPADWDRIPDAVPAKFDLCYTGSMYDGKRSPELLFAAIAKLRERGDEAGFAARVHFYGPNSERVSECAARYGLSLVLRQHGVVPRQDALRAQRAAAAVLIFLNTDPNTIHEMGSKYLEYLGARRPMLAFGPEGSALGATIEEHNLGWFASDVDRAASALRGAYERFRSGKFHIEPDHRFFPSAPVLARRFADIFNDVTGSRGTRLGVVGETAPAPSLAGERL